MDSMQTLVEQIKSSKNYRHISQDVIEKAVGLCMPKYKKKKDAVKAAKTLLHRMTNSFAGESDRKALDRLHEQMKKLDPQMLNFDQEMKSTCEALMRLHVSTAERIDFYEPLYCKVFKTAGYPSSILDVACGLNPLSIPWMRNVELKKMMGVDTDMRCIRILQTAANIFGFPLEATALDVTALSFDHQRFDLGLIFKFMPVLDMQQSETGRAFLMGLPCDRLLVSYPQKSLSGAQKGMKAFYTERFYSTIEDAFIVLEQWEYDTEFFFLIEKA